LVLETLRPARRQINQGNVKIASQRCELRYALKQIASELDLLSALRMLLQLLRQVDDETRVLIGDRNSEQILESRILRIIILRLTRDRLPFELTDDTFELYHISPWREQCKTDTAWRAEH